MVLYIDDDLYPTLSVCVYLALCVQALEIKGAMPSQSTRLASRPL